MKTVLFVLISALILPLIIPVDCMAAEDETKVTVQGIRIIGSGYIDEKKEEGDGNLNAFGWSEGTTISLLIFRPSGGIVSFLKDKSELESMVCDKGGDLFKTTKKSWGTPSRFGSFPKKSNDGKAIFIEILGQSAPLPGATSISTKGKIVLSVATQTETTETKNVKISVDEIVKCGTDDLEITTVGKPGWGDYERSITLHGKGDQNRIKEIIFYDDEGKELDFKKGSSSWTGSGENATFDLEYQLKKKAASATVKVTYWTDMKELEVPLDMKVSVGVGE